MSSIPEGIIMGSYGPPPKRFLYFNHLIKKLGAKTDRWLIRSHDGQYLGRIRFYPQWRCYVAELEPGTVWSWDCCAELSKFIKEKTDAWRSSKKHGNVKG